jgi:hypothetical protein
MALQRSIDKAAYTSLDASVKALYAERDGKYVLDVDDSPMLSALDTERAAKKALEQRLAAYGDMTPELAKGLSEQKSRAEREKDLAAGNFEKILAEERAQATKTLEMQLAEQARLKGTLQEALVNAEAVRAITAMKGNPELLLPIVSQRAKLQTVGDREVAVIIGDKGGPRLKAGAKTADDYMSIPEYVAELRADARYKGAFEANVGSGSGRAAGAGMNQPMSASKQETMEKAVQMLKEGATRIGEL